MTKKQKILSAIAAVVVIIACSLLLWWKPISAQMFDWFVADTLENQLEQTYQPVRQTGGEQESQEPSVVMTEPFSILLVGSDQRKNEKARSDTLIYAVVRPMEPEVLLISIPRDTYTEIIGRDRMDKINHAYAFGGIKMTMDTVEHFLDEDLDYYASVNFQGLVNAVDALGGVKLPIEKDIVNRDPNHEKFTIKAGKPIYSGQEALYYVRYREDSDFNRTKRQQIFLQSITDQAIQLNQIDQIPELLNIMGSNFKTDMRPQMLTGLASQIMRGGDPKITSFTIAGEGEYIDGVYYDVPNEEDLEKAKHLIDQWMSPQGPEPSTDAKETANPVNTEAQSKVQ
ncbi:LCP family protein [Paenibacillus bovis]|uniref:Transcriptional regulator n=1 Tax=Paenibacillus bovis TaxID=1616788 RepID=A0A172ZCG7_9BACL|nr:LCP family protein [Paenibacillus bovis]ANF95062.1 transcriptional regulator [Paenibacillus bovis]